MKKLPFLGVERERERECDMFGDVCAREKREREGKKVAIITQ